MGRSAPPTPLGELRPAADQPARYVPLWRGKGKTVFAFLLTSPRTFGIATHWDGARILPCTAQLGACLPCRNGWDRRWRGFLSGLSCATKGQYLLCVTELAWRECAELALHDGDLRGRTFSVGRIGDKSNAPWKWNYAAFARVEPPRPAVDLVEQLGRLWGIDLGKLQARRDFNGDVRPFLIDFKKSAKRGKK